MITLVAKKPQNVGNGILYGFDLSDHDGSQLFLVETDFGNHMRLNSKEVDELFRLGREQTWAEWREARRALIEKSYEQI